MKPEEQPVHALEASEDTSSTTQIQNQTPPPTPTEQEPIHFYKTNSAFRDFICQYKFDNISKTGFEFFSDENAQFISMKLNELRVHSGGLTIYFRTYCSFY